MQAGAEDLRGIAKEILAAMNKAAARYKRNDPQITNPMVLSRSYSAQILRETMSIDFSNRFSN
jgi:hypothetical protein